MLITLMIINIEINKIMKKPNDMQLPSTKGGL